LSKSNAWAGAGNGPGWEAVIVLDAVENGELLKAMVRVKARVVESTRLKRAARDHRSRAL
jgi:hypothetical protein